MFVHMFVCILYLPWLFEFALESNHIPTLLLSVILLLALFIHERYESVRLVVPALLGNQVLNPRTTMHRCDTILPRQRYLRSRRC